MAAIRFTLFLTFLVLLPATELRADRIVLRNLDIISDTTVERFDEDGVQLSDGSLISWDRIEKGRVAEAKQAAFDKMLKELGAHLYRIRQRLSINDDRGMLPHAQAVHDRYVGRRSATAYMVFQALMWSRLATGQREAALQPYLECVECLRQAAADDKKLTLPGSRHLQVDLKTGLSPELSPIWFDTEAAQQSLAGVGKTISNMVKPRPPGTRVYYATLALAAGEPDKASQALAGLEQLPQWKAIIQAQVRMRRGETDAAISALSQELEQLPKNLKPLALYSLGQAQLTKTDPAAHKTGLLDLLRIPALFGKTQPELAAAGLYVAMHALAKSGDIKGSIALRRELLDHYGQTWHAEQLRKEDKKVRKQP